MIIKTEYGNVLLEKGKYKIKRKCHICKEKIDCICLDELNEAIKELKIIYFCDEPECIIKYYKTLNPKDYKRIEQDIISEGYNSDEEYYIAGIISDILGQEWVLDYRKC